MTFVRFQVNRLTYDWTQRINTNKNGAKTRPSHRNYRLRPRTMGESIDDSANPSRVHPRESNDTPLSVPHRTRTEGKSPLRGSRLKCFKRNQYRSASFD
ncbi:hypothetical protein EVAR_26742_1 [Eumeta japonica]|uniref:Uncharacterized protein n=1 Tax=Eumeta variegata TaxID=151549 RepID=A0A4C1XB77_EUMVA|nr:hypothetical protein EVAR_26742_1 [Eumeta japonica]